MFEQELGSVLRYLARGVGVRIVGAPGSGRTTLAKQVVTELEDRGTTVESIFADPSLESVPFAGVLSLGVDLGPRPLGVLGVANALSAHLERSHVIAVDGVEHLDRESLAVIDVVQGRLDVPIVVTAGDAPFRARPTVTAVLGRWRQATVVIPSLRYKQVASLLAQKLGAPADVDVAARILSGSGGNLRLAARIIETAVLADRLVLRDGRWQLNGPTLVNEHLHGTIEALLHGLGSEEFRALQKLALLGPSPLDRLTGLVGTGILDRLEHRGLLSVVAGGEGALLVSVFPPVVEDYLRGHVNSSRRILRSAITEALAASESAEPARRPDATDAVAAIAALRAEMHGSHAATAQRFHTRLGELERLYYRAWEADRSMPNAVAFLRVYWGAPIDHARIREVFDRTDPAGAEPADHLFFAMTRALWMALTGKGLAPAVAVMAEFAGSEPGWAPEAEAWSLLLETAYERVPADLGVTLARLSSRNPRCGVVPIVRGLLEIIRFNPEAALRELDSAAGFESIPRFEPLVRGLGLFASGRVDEAIAYALERRRDAQLAVDQFTLVTQSYIAALALIDRGLFDEAEYIMGSAFALGRPGFLVDSLYNAMLRLSSLRLHSASLGGHAGNSARSVGTLPSVGKGVYELVTQPPAGAEAFDGAASHLIDEQLAHGYAFDAAHTALFTLCLVPGPGVKARAQSIMDEHGVTRHRQLLAIADAVLGAETGLVTELLEAYSPDGDAYRISALLRGAAAQLRRRDAHVAAAAVERAQQDFAARFETSSQFVTVSPGGASAALTAREAEIALLAASRSNQEIAKQLGLSVRTVESHISKALKKTGAATRRQLAERMRSAPSS